MISDKQGQMLLEMARTSIAEKLGLPVGKSRIDLDQSFLENKLGLFVTLHKNSRLRGCIGVIEPVEPLKTGVKEIARLAAFKIRVLHPLPGMNLTRLIWRSVFCLCLKSSSTMGQMI